MKLKPCPWQIKPEGLELMELKSRADLILQLHPAIRHVAIIDNSNTVVDCKGTETFSLPLSREQMRQFVDIQPLIILAATECKLQPCGRIKFLVALFEKALLVIYQLQNYMVVLVLDSILDMESLKRIATILEKMDPA